MKKAEYAVIVISITTVETSGGLDNGWNNRERRFDVTIPVNTVKSIDFNKIRNELLDSSIEAFETQNDDTKA
jgi:hypothetical protein